MDNNKFLEQVLGQEGFYCVVGLKTEADRPIQKFYKTIENVVSAAESLVKEGYNAYYALATFVDGKSRKAVNVNHLKSLYLDLDCGEGKPYTNQQEAINALKEFCIATKLPKPTLVNSGGGVHVYWTLDEPVSRETWQPLADKLKYLCDVHGLFADPSVTADPARILRIPGTLNLKQDTPRPVELIGVPAQPKSYNTLKDIIGEPVKARKSFIPPREMDEVTKALLGNYTNRFKTILDKTLKGSGCQQIKYVIENQETMSEPMWRAGLSIAKFCVDADIAIHKISCRHPEYDPNETERKVYGIKGGPYTCAKFEEFNPKGCDGCGNKGIIKSPIVLGREVLEATEEDNVIEDTPINMPSGISQIYVIPEYPAPYFRGKQGGIFKRIINKDGEDQEVLIYQHDLYVSRRLHDPEFGESIVIRLHLPKDGVREFTMPFASVSSKDEVRKYLGSNGVTLMKFEDIQYYLNTWVMDMQHKIKSDVAKRQFGWVGNNFESFVLGDKEVFADRVEYNPPTSSTAGLFTAFEPKGTYEKWKEAMSFFEQPGMETHQMAIGYLLGSIFTKFTPFNGAILHLYSEDGGLGKTTAGLAALAAFGDPMQLMLKERDTTASKMNRLELYCNIGALVDELTNMTGKDLSDFTYSVPMGTQRSRMSASSNQERYRGLEWALSVLTTGNADVIEKMSMFKAMPKAEALRILQVEVFPVPNLDKTKTDELVELIKQNYGHAWYDLLTYVINNIPKLKDEYKTVRQSLDKVLDFGPQNRYQSLIVTNAVMGVIVGNRLGFFNYNVRNLVAHIKRVVKIATDRSYELHNDAETTLVNFIAENHNNILRIKSTEDNRGKQDLTETLILPDAQPRAQFVIRHEYDVKMLYIYPAPLKHWCIERQINYNGLIEALKKGRSQAKIAKKRMGKGTKMNLPAVPVLHINCGGFLDDELEAEIKAAGEHVNKVDGAES